MEAEDRISQLRAVRLVLQRKIRDSPVVSHLLSSGFISEDNANIVKNLYHKGEHQQATECMIDILLASRQKGFVQALSDALQAEGYEYLAKLCQFQEGVDENNYDHGKRVVLLFGPYLQESMKAIEVLSFLLSKGLINETDQEKIIACKNNHGDRQAVEVMCDRMTTKKSSKEWYSGFLESLLESNNKHVVEAIEPDFLEDRQRFLDNYDQLCSGQSRNANGSDTCARSSSSYMYSNSCSPMSQDCASSCQANDDDTMEHMAYYESDASLNNLSPPPAKCEKLEESPPSLNVESQEFLSAASSLPQPSCSYIEETKVSNLLPNLEEANIKPEVVDKDLPPSGSGQNRVPKKEESKEEEERALDSDDDDWLDDGPDSRLQLRDYQLELAEDAVAGKNTIICAPTGSGKTWVALYIIKAHLAKAAAGPRNVIFMAKTGALVKQQSDRFKKLLPNAHTKLITGDDDDSKKVGLFLDDYDIICLTPQILINNLDNGSIESVSKLSLLILDECHHTKKDEPYNNLMRRYLMKKTADPGTSLPQIIGMTASIGVGKSNTDQEACEYVVQMCARLDARIVSVVKRNVEQLEKNTVNIQDEVIKMQKRYKDPCKALLMEAIAATEEWLQDEALMQPALSEYLCKIPEDKESQEYQKWSIDVKKVTHHKIEDVETMRNILACAMYLNNYNAALEVNSLLQTKDVIHFLAEKNMYEEQQKNKHNSMECQLLTKLKEVMKGISRLQCENPNVTVVLKTLKTMLDEKGEESRAMVFVKQRATCKAMARFLDDALKSTDVRVGDLYGKENKGSEDGMTEAVQNERLEKFRSGLLKVLVATSVGTEGIDVPDNNIVLSYNYSGNEITKTQMKGRIRKAGGANIIMGSDPLIEREMMNAYKVSLMNKGLALFQQLPIKSVERKVALFQKEEVHQYKQQKYIEEAMKNKKRPGGNDLEIQCIRCKTTACMLGDVRRIDRQHIVIDPTFKERVKQTPHKSPKKYDGFHKKFKMWCLKCPMDWGIVQEKKGMSCFTLKLSSFRFFKEGTYETSTYKDWISVPYDIPEIDDAALERYLGPEVKSEAVYQRD